MAIPKAATPFVAGAILGAVLITGLGFGNDWVVSSQSKSLEVTDAWINAQASVCASRIQQHLKANASAVSLKGYEATARDARGKLAIEFAIALPGKEKVESIVVSACSQMLAELV